MLGERVDSWMRRHESLVDVGTALALVAGCVLFGAFVEADAGYFLLSLWLLLPLTVRRRHPVPAAAVVLAAALVQWLTVRDSTGALPADVAVPMVIYALAACGPVWGSRIGLVVGLIGAGMGGLAWPQLPVRPLAHVLVAAFLGSTVVAAWAFGTLHRARGKHIAALAERARLLEVEREQRDRIAVMAERTRIAREMHDVVAHSLAVLIAQADGGRYAAANEPAAATTTLATIGDYARQALDETRRVLGVLRDGPATVDEPQPGVDDIPALVDRVRAGGLDVRLTLDAPRGPVESGLGLVAFRIVQEGLTNVIKHAGQGVRAEVSVRWRPRRLEIDVLDDGRGTPAATAAGAGHGVLGMRERANAYGGTVTLASRPGGGRVLRARIPVPR